MPIKTQAGMPSTESMDHAFCMLLDAGASLSEAWDYAPRIGADWRVMIAYTPRDVKLDLEMWRRASKIRFYRGLIETSSACI